MLRSLFICCIILCCSTSNAVAQTKGYEYTDTTLLEGNGDSEPSNNIYEETDTNLYKHVINISSDTIEAWKDDKKFAYAKNLDSLLKLKNAEEQDSYQSTPNSTSPSLFQSILSLGFVQLFFWVIAIGVVIFILYKLFLNKGIFRRSTTSLPVKEIPEEPVIKNVSDYDALIQQSFKLADYRMGVRYLFLKTLLRLTDKGLLQGSTDKTNFQYVQEITEEKKTDFASLVLNYEYVWYGNLKISREQYEYIEKAFTFFYNKI